MKKFTLILATLITFTRAYCQPTLFNEAPLYDNSTSTGRGPNGTSAHVTMRACALVLATELTAIVTNNTITAFGFSVNSGSSGSAAVGNFSLYFQNTTDVTYNKGTTYATAITGMTQVYGSILTIPISATSTSFVITLSTPFVYSGGGLYVAYDWYNPSGPYSTAAAVYRCNSLGLSPGLASAASTSTTAPTTLATTAFRPTFLFGVNNPYTNDIQFIGIDAPGRVNSSLNVPHSIVGTVRNSSSITNNNVVVSLNIGGANPSTASQTISSIAAGAVGSVTFTGLNPQNLGLNTITVSVPSDQNNVNNVGAFNQSVTCNEWAINPAAVSYSQGSVGFNTGSGIIATTYSTSANTTLTAIRGAVSTNTPAIGNQAWGVLLNSTGAIVATTNTITITAANLGTFVTLSFPTPQALSAGTTYYFGFAQPANTTLGYFPIGTYTASSYVPYTNYVTTTTVGSTPTPLASSLGYFAIEGIFVSNMPLNVTASSTYVCLGNTATITATGASTYSWTSGPGLASSSFTDAPVSTITYSVIGTSTNGCTKTALVPMVVNSFSNLSVSATATTICLGNSITVSAIGANSYTWNYGASTTTNSILQTNPNASAIYTVTGADVLGCKDFKTVNVTVNSFTPTTVASTLLCQGNQITISASGGAANTYTWSNSFPFQSILVSPTVTTTYSVAAFGLNGCLGFATTNVSVVPNPPLVASAQRTFMCKGETNTLTASGASSYTWSNGGGNNAVAVINPSVNVLTNYTVMGSDANGCISTVVVPVSVNVCSGLDAIASSGQLLSVYPNPSGGLLNIRFESAPDPDLSVRLVNALGQVVAQIAQPGIDNRLNIENEPGGIYFVCLLKANKPISVNKVVKQ